VEDGVLLSIPSGSWPSTASLLAFIEALIFISDLGGGPGYACAKGALEMELNRSLTHTIILTPPIHCRPGPRSPRRFDGAAAICGIRELCNLGPGRPLVTSDSPSNVIPDQPLERSAHWALDSLQALMPLHGTAWPAFASNFSLSSPFDSQTNDDRLRGLVPPALSAQAGGRGVLCCHRAGTTANVNVDGISSAC